MTQNKNIWMIFSSIFYGQNTEIIYPGQMRVQNNFK